MKIRVPIRHGVVPNHILHNKKLSMKSKGLYAYIQSKTDNRDFSVKRMSQDSKDGKDSISAGLKELEDLGYLVRTKTHDEQ